MRSVYRSNLDILYLFQDLLMSSFLELTRATNEPRYTFYSLVLLSPIYRNSQAWHSVRYKGEACGGDRVYLALAVGRRWMLCIAI